MSKDLSPATWRCGRVLFDFVKQTKPLVFSMLPLILFRMVVSSKRRKMLLLKLP
jgi:hypothetical protein